MDNKQFCLKLYYLRTREKKMTQKKVATELEIRQATLSNLEQGSSMPSLDILMKLCEFYNVTPTWLLDDSAPLCPTGNDRWAARTKVRGKVPRANPAAERKLSTEMQEELTRNAQRRRGYKDQGEEPKVRKPKAKKAGRKAAKKAPRKARAK